LFRGAVKEKQKLDYINKSIDTDLTKGRPLKCFEEYQYVEKAASSKPTKFRKARVTKDPYKSFSMAKFLSVSVSIVSTALNLTIAQ